MKLFLTGIKLPKLGSLQDRIIRQHMTSESQKETKKVQFLALLAINSVSTADVSSTTEWEKKVKNLWTSYLGLEYGVEIPEDNDKEIEMMEYYQSTVKNLKAQLSMKAGQLTVTGLDKLKA
jgi:hypothetical protein